MVKQLPNRVHRILSPKQKARYAYNHSGTSGSGYYNFDAYDLSSKDLSETLSPNLQKIAKDLKNNQRSIIYNGNYVRYEDMKLNRKGF